MLNGYIIFLMDDKTIIYEIKKIEEKIKSANLPEDLRDKSLIMVERLNFAKKWVNEFAPEQYTFELQKKIPDVELNEKQKKALKILAEKLKKGKWTEQTLYNEFYTICRDEVDIPTNEFFTAAYKVLLNREKGPKLAGFLLLVKEKAVKLFESL